MVQLNNQLPKIKFLVKLFLGYPLTILSFYFIFKIIFNNKNAITTHFQQVNIPILFLGIIFFLIYFLLRGIGWNKILKNLGYEVENPIDSIYRYSYAEIKRYIPGNILAFIARSKSFSEKKIPIKVSLTGIILESFLIIIASATLSIFSLPIILNILEKSTNRTYIFIFFAIIIAFFGALFVLIKKIKLNNIKLWSWIDTYFLYVICWGSFGLASFLTASAFVYLDITKFTQLISLFISSWLIGYISIVTPMGLGVREAAITVGLSQFMPIPLASSISILTRIVLIISEITFLGLVSSIKSTKAYTMLKKHSISNQFIALLFFSISYIGYFTYVSFEKHINFFTGRFDLGNMDQTVWNTINGKIFMLTNPDNTNTISRLGVHADFILILLSPLYIIWQDPRMLLLIQSVVLGLGAVFVYLIGVKILQNKNISLAIALSYLLNPFLQKQNLYDFHAVTLATTFLLATFYFLIKRKYILFVIFLVLSALTKENVYLVTALIGIYMIFSKKLNLESKKEKIMHLITTKRTKVGLAITFFSLLIFFLLVTKFIPDARGGSDHFALSYYSDFGDSPSQIIKNIIFKPQKTIPLFFTQANLKYFKELLLPVGFLSILSPFYLIFALPDLLINLLSNNQNLKSMNYHYAAVILPFIYISAIYGIKRILSLKIKVFNHKIITYYLIFISLFTAWNYGPLPGSKNPALEIYTKKVKERNDIEAFLKKIPSNLSVAATNNIGAHISHRNEIYTIPLDLDKADLDVFLLNDEFAQPSLKEQKKLVSKMSKDNKYVKIYAEGDFVVFIKKELADTIK